MHQSIYRFQKNLKWLLTAALALSLSVNSTGQDNPKKAVQDELTSVRPADLLTFPIVDTGQDVCYGEDSEIANPVEGQPFFGQDSQHEGYAPRYVDNGNGTITDKVTALMWQKTPSSEKSTFGDALAGAEVFNLAEYDDWRLPTIKELYSLIDFTGVTGQSAATSIPYLDIDFFDFVYGDESAGERFIDAQYWSSTEYVSTTMNNFPTTFGVNFADGRIKGYGRERPDGTEMEQYVRYVRGNPDYGVNDLVDNGDGTITDRATGLMWMEMDSGAFDAGDWGDGAMNWEQALTWASNLAFAGHSDWRLPNAKELQSIVDYSRSPDTSDSAAIDPVFEMSTIIDESGLVNYPFFWTSTTHLDGRIHGEYAAYVAFGEALGFMETPPNSGNYQLQDVHGAGAQRSDPKSGDPASFPYGHGPQGDVIRIYNHVRCVRDIPRIVSSSCTYSIDPTEIQLGSDGGSVEVEITTTQTCDWTASSNVSWIDVSPSVGRGSGILQIVVDPSSTSRTGSVVIEGRVLSINQTGSGAPQQAGLNLFTPLNSTRTYLMDEDGETVKTWESGYQPGNAVYMLDENRVMRCGNTRDRNFDAGGQGGVVEIIDLDGIVEWSFEYSDAFKRLHHDIEPLPNGNVLMIAWEYKSESDALAAGRHPNLLSQGALWPDTVIEVQPSGPDSGQIVWEWHVWDHLIQDVDPTKSNYGVVSDHPELIDINYSTGIPPGSADCNHTNAIDYQAELDQILLSVRHFSEIWIIDHSTTTQEASGHSGGNSGQGGDLLYRWGNPQAFQRGGPAEQKLFGQHDAQWIPAGYPGEGHILVFNNGNGRMNGNYSSVDEFIPPQDGFGGYVLYSGDAYGPTAVHWQFMASPAQDFYADRISGAQRLPNGNTLICEGTSGYFFEVTPAGEMVWDYAAGSNVFRVTRHYLD